jgi:hypothetical protein
VELGMRKRLCYAGFVVDHTKRRVWWVVVLVCLAALLSLSGRWLHGHWAETDFQDKILNFSAVWLPFVLSIIIAFIPSSETRRKAHMRWRFCLIAAGLATSIVMWRQQDRAIDAARRDREAAAHAQQVAISQAITAAVSQSVEKSTKHSDEQTEAVKKELHAQIEHSTQALTGVVDKDVSTIAGKIKPTGVAKLVFSFLSPGLDRKALLTTMHVHLTDDIAKFSVVFYNDSEVIATNPQITVRCITCMYAKEPDGFSRLDGSIEQDRHKLIQGAISPGSFVFATPLEIRIPSGSSKFVVRLSYVCETCGRDTEDQILTGIVDN